MSKKLINIGGQQNDKSYRYKMPELIAKREGRGNGVRTAFLNISEVSKCLKIDPIYPTKYFGIELCAHSSYTKKTDRCVINGHYPEAKLFSTMEDFIEKFVLCDRCNLPEITLRVDKKKKMAIKKCAACGIKTRVDPSHKLTAFIIKNPPYYEKSSLNKSKQQKTHSDINTQVPEPEIEMEKINKEDFKETEFEGKNGSIPTIPEEKEVKNSPRTTKKGQKRDTVDADDSPILRDLMRSNASAKTLIDEIGRMEIANGALEKSLAKQLIAKVVVNALLGGLGAPEAVKEVKRQKDFLQNLFQRDELIGSAILDALVEYLTTRKELRKTAPVVVSILFEDAGLKEEDILSWFKNGEPGEVVRKECKDFVEWLENAEEESESGD